MRGVLVAALLWVAATTPTVADVLWECPKTFTLSSQLGIIDRPNGTDYIRYVPGQFICDMIAPDSDECYFRYRSLIETPDAVVGFLRRSRYPTDTQVIVLDLLNSKFYKTTQQGDLKTSIFGECQNVGENKLQLPPKTPRDDALSLIMTVLFVPGVAAYCNKNVEANSELLDAARQWNERNRKFHLAIVATLEASGGLSAIQKDTLDKAALELVKQKIEEEQDKSSFCSDLVGIANSGQLDLDKMDDTKAPLARLMGQAAAP